MRAVHQLLDHPPVLDDPLARRIVGLTDENTGIVTSDPYHTDRVGRAFRAKLAARSRYAEDQLARAIQHGVAQYVVLGAGLDTFAYRHRYGSALTVYEVDLPETQAWKRQLLAEASIAEPEGLIYVGVDFSRQTAFEGLRDAGFDASKPAFFSWLGVTMYLTEPVVFAVLQDIASLPAGSGVVFDYNVNAELLTPMQQMVMEAIANRAASVGEPWTLSFDPAVLVASLHRIGFSQVEDLGRDEINARYFAGRADQLKVGSIGRFIGATV